MSKAIDQAVNLFSDIKRVAFTLALICLAPAITKAFFGFPPDAVAWVIVWVIGIGGIAVGIIFAFMAGVTAVKGDGRGNFS